MADPYTEFYAVFLQDHPEELAGVKMVTIAGERELVMSTATLRRFITWALGMGLVREVDTALGMLGDLPNLDERVRQAHAAQQAPE